MGLSMPHPTPATMARAREHAAALDELRQTQGEPFMRRVERMWLQSPWDLVKSEWHAQRLVVFEWMAAPWQRPLPQGANGSNAVNGDRAGASSVPTAQGGPE